MLQHCIDCFLLALTATVGLFPNLTSNADAADLLHEIPVNKWVKISPLASTPPSPQLGYEGDCVWDTQRSQLIRYGGHNQGGGGEQNSELWTFDPQRARWSLTHPNIQPPGVCCAQQNVFDASAGNYVRFPAFSHSHGWQWMREIYLNNTSVWTFDPDRARWRNMRPLPSPYPQSLRCASWDSDHQALVLFGGEASKDGTWVYEPSTNQWFDMNPPEQPMFRSSGNMVYDSRNKRHVLFGAQYKDDAHTWAYDLKTNRWHDLKPPSMPPTKANDAVLAYDSVNGVVLAVIKQSEGEWETAKHTLSTWAYDLGKNTWTEMLPKTEPDPSGDRCRDMMFAPTLNILLLENRTADDPGDEDGPKGGEQQIWAYRFAKRPNISKPLSSVRLRAEVTASSVRLHWQYPPNDKGNLPSPAPAEYVIYRNVGDTSWGSEFKPLATVGADQTSFIDNQGTSRKICRYFIQAKDAKGNPGRKSTIVSTQPPLVDELIVSVLATNRIQLNWVATEGEADQRYVVERAPVEVHSEAQLNSLVSRTKPLTNLSVGAIDRVGHFIKLTKEPIKTTSYEDTGIDLSKPKPIDGEYLYDEIFIMEQHLVEDAKPYRFGVYAYRVRAVSPAGVMGGRSPVKLTIPSPVEHLFARDDEAACDLRWKPNKEKAITGYRVYRIDGRWDETDPVSRLTEEPISETTYRDERTDNRTRRYHVIAVDAIGQEGHPSSPVWYSREWKSFYKPFDEEWHQ